ncbi:glycosyltransferase family 61 protein [Alteromonas sp. M12]|uniref:glycosyltransferase family 61 protein n=1 Tax=Alteromonas sp. M12 TaxID=3135644 RepID=UPI00319DDFA1
MFLDAAINFTDIKSYENIYEDVYIDTKTSAVLDSNLTPIYETLYEIIFWWKGTLHGRNMVDPELRKIEVQRRYEEILKETDTITKDDIANAKILADDVEAIYAMSAHGWYPYGHLHDSLLRLYPWRDTKFSKPKVLCSKYNRVVDFSLHLKAFGFDESSIFRAGPQYRLIKVKKLFYGVNEAKYWTNISPEQYSWMLNGYFSLFDKSPENEPKINGLYLSRNHVGRRGVVNNEEVENLLESKYNFKVLTGNENLKDIISLFARARNIVGPHGSIFVNTIFCGDNCNIIEYCPSNRPDFSFQRKYKRASNYKHVLLDADNDHNIILDTDSLESLLTASSSNIEREKP